MYVYNLSCVLCAIRVWPETEALDTRHVDASSVLELHAHCPMGLKLVVEWWPQAAEKLLYPSI